MKGKINANRGRGWQRKAFYDQIKEKVTRKSRIFVKKDKIALQTRALPQKKKLPSPRHYVFITTINYRL